MRVRVEGRTVLASEGELLRRHASDSDRQNNKELYSQTLAGHFLTLTVSSTQVCCRDRRLFQWSVDRGDWTLTPDQMRRLRSSAINLKPLSLLPGGYGTVKEHDSIIEGIVLWSVQGTFRATDPLSSSPTQPTRSTHVLRLKALTLHSKHQL